MTRSARTVRRDGRMARRRIQHMIRRKPGLHKTRLAEVLGMGWGTLNHHLKVMEQEETAKVVRHRRQARVYPLHVDVEGVALMAPLRDVYGPLLEELHVRPGARLHELAETMGLSRKVLRRHLDALDRQGILEVEGHLQRRYRIDYHRHRPGDVLPRFKVPGRP